MANREQRGNREKKKPKQPKTAATQASPLRSQTTADGKSATGKKGR